MKNIQRRSPKNNKCLLLKNERPKGSESAYTESESLKTVITISKKHLKEL